MNACNLNKKGVKESYLVLMKKTFDTLTQKKNKNKF